LRRTLKGRCQQPGQAGSAAAAGRMTRDKISLLRPGRCSSEKKRLQAIKHIGIRRRLQQQTKKEQQCPR
jgi:hypothetical protein